MKFGASGLLLFLSVQNVHCITLGITGKPPRRWRMSLIHYSYCACAWPRPVNVQQGGAVHQNMPSDRLWNAIQKVETGKEPNPEVAKGDKGAAIGPLQIHEVYYNDAVQFDPSLQSGQYAGYTYKNCEGPGSFEYSKKVGNAYMARYATAKRLGHTPTDEDFARIHNGGPNGWKDNSTPKSTATLGYWHEVQAALQSQ